MKHPDTYTIHLSKDYPIVLDKLDIGDGFCIYSFDMCGECEWNRVAAWELQLTASAQPQERGPYCTSVAQKRSKFKLQSPVSSECLSLSHHCKAEKSSSQTITSQGPFI